jgi:small-conductance mechanosensitive channel
MILFPALSFFSITPIKVNDVIEVDGIVCRVQEIKLRTSTVMTREDKCIILPNSVITTGKVVNWTYSHLTSRFEVALNVAYTADVPAVMALLKNVTLEHKAVSRYRSPPFGSRNSVNPLLRLR